MARREEERGLIDHPLTWAGDSNVVKITSRPTIAEVLEDFFLKLFLVVIILLLLL